MMTYCKPLLVSLVLSTACDPPSNNVGDVPTTTEGSTEGDTDHDTDTGAATGSVDTGTGTATSVGAETETAGSSESTGDMEGSCLDTSYDCFDGLHEPLECGGSLVCDVLEVNDPSLNDFDPDPFAFVNPDAATCILEGLAAGTVGTYAIAVEPGQQYSVAHRLEVLTDGTLIIRRQEQEDKTCSGHENRFEAQPASYFEACAAETDEALVLECLLGAGDSVPCVDPGFECPA
jgi:hypothetical protein